MSGAGCGLAELWKPDGSSLTYDSTAFECRTPIRLSALKDRLIAARLRSLYLSSHSLEMAWMEKHTNRHTEKFVQKKCLLFTTSQSYFKKSVQSKEDKSSLSASHQRGKTQLKSHEIFLFLWSSTV